MTLKEKLFDAVFDNAYEFKKENVIPQCEQIAEDFAMGFANWCMDYKRIGRSNVGDMQYSKDDYDFAYTMEELLQIYKKEKGL